MAREYTPLQVLVRRTPMRQADLAAALGRSSNSVSNLLKGHTELTISVAAKIAEALNLPLIDVISAGLDTWDRD